MFVQQDTAASHQAGEKSRGQGRGQLSRAKHTCSSMVLKHAPTLQVLNDQDDFPEPVGQRWG